MKISTNYNYNKAENYLVKSNCVLTSKILEKIINEYHKINDLSSIYKILQLCKNKKLAIPYEALSMSSKILEDMVKYTIENNNELKNAPTYQIIEKQKEPIENNTQLIEDDYVLY